MSLRKMVKKTPYFIGTEELSPLSQKFAVGSNYEPLKFRPQLYTPFLKD
jgi:hypothetical protein